MRLLLAILLCALSAGAQSPTASGPHVSVTLLSENSALQPGKPAWLGLHFQLDKGWHVYWQNPGDSGEPPKADWQLPPGFKAGALQFPAPQRLPLQTLMNFGYEDEVLYPVRIEVPATAAGSARIAASLRWMVCADTCIPGKGIVSLNLPVNRNSQPTAAAPLFRKTVSRLPEQLDATRYYSASIRGDEVRFSVLARGPFAGDIRAAEFFPLDDLVIENAAPQKLSPTRGKAPGFTLSLQRSAQSPRPPERLHGVLVINGQKAYVVSMPISRRPAAP